LERKEEKEYLAPFRDLDEPRKIMTPRSILPLKEQLKGQFEEPVLMEVLFFASDGRDTSHPLYFLTVHM
jgi:hypothetical protein